MNGSRNKRGFGGRPKTECGSQKPVHGSNFCAIDLEDDLQLKLQNGVADLDFVVGGEDMFIDFASIHNRSVRTIQIGQQVVIAAHLDFSVLAGGLRIS